MQTTLDYRRPSQQTLTWHHHGDSRDWKAALSTPEFDEIVLRRDARTRIVRAECRDERWWLKVRLLTIEVRLPGEDPPVAVLRRRLFSHNEIKFADGRTVHIERGRSFRMTLTDELKFVERDQLLLTIRPVLGLIGDRQVCIETTDAGFEFPGRAILAVLGFHNLVARDHRE